MKDSFPLCISSFLFPAVLNWHSKLKPEWSSHCRVTKADRLWAINQMRIHQVSSRVSLHTHLTAAINKSFFFLFSEWDTEQREGGPSGWYGNHEEHIETVRDQESGDAKAVSKFGKRPAGWESNKRAKDKGRNEERWMSSSSFVQATTLCFMFLNNHKNSHAQWIYFYNM